MILCCNRIFCSMPLGWLISGVFQPQKQGMLRTSMASGLWRRGHIRVPYPHQFFLSLYRKVGCYTMWTGQWCSCFCLFSSPTYNLLKQSSMFNRNIICFANQPLAKAPVLEISWHFLILHNLANQPKDTSGPLLVPSISGFPWWIRWDSGRW